MVEKLYVYLFKVMLVNYFLYKNINQILVQITNLFIQKKQEFDMKLINYKTFDLLIRTNKLIYVIPLYFQS